MLSIKENIFYFELVITAHIRTPLNVMSSAWTHQDNILTYHVRVQIRNSPDGNRTR